MIIMNQLRVWDRLEWRPPISDPQPMGCAGQKHPTSHIAGLKGFATKDLVPDVSAHLRS